MTEPPELPSGIQVVEGHLEMSDGVILRLFELSRSDAGEQGPTIVFVPGWISSIQAWHAVLEVLTTQYSVIYVETREKPSARLPANRIVDFSVDRLAKDVQEVLDAWVPPDRPFCFMGSSLGSTVIAACLSRGGRQPLVALLIAPKVAFNVPPWFLRVAAVVPMRLLSILKPLVKWYLCKFLLDLEKEPDQAVRYRGYIDSAEPRRLLESAKVLDKYDGWGSLPHITAPVVIISSRTDKLHGLANVRRIASLIPKARLRIMASNLETHSEKVGLLVLEEIDEVTWSGEALRSGQEA